MTSSLPVWAIVLIVIASALLVYVGTRCLRDKDDDKKD